MRLLYRLLCFFGVHPWVRESGLGFKWCEVCHDNLNKLEDIEAMRPSKIIVRKRNSVKYSRDG